MESCSEPTTLSSHYRDSGTRYEAQYRDSDTRHEDKYRDSGTRLNIETLARGTRINIKTLARVSISRFWADVSKLAFTLQTFSPHQCEGRCLTDPHTFRT
ncbi:hypothetical protein AVEN_149523-1 [Araneus ventricosus]|uniref:Uncharacterized protein n=1 Tax=Araneus ventricosus TaxID=182803 RepID=A0A4Y2K5Y1_ARAVE|nr:hypothetical protein AVEN_149523-1 [Araneus ventricosus]